MSGCCRGLPAKVCIARPYGRADGPPPDDPHPEVAYLDGKKLSVMGCACEHCFREQTRHDRERFR